MTGAYAEAKSKGKGNLPPESQVNNSFCTGKSTTDAAQASVERGFYLMKRLLKNTCEDHNKTTGKLTHTYVCMRESSVLPVGQQSFEGDLTHALIGWQQPRPVPCPVHHCTLLMYEDRVLLVINQG